MRVYKERINRLFFCHTASDNQYYVNLNENRKRNLCDSFSMIFCDIKFRRFRSFLKRFLTFILYNYCNTPTNSRKVSDCSNKYRSSYFPFCPAAF